MLPCGQRLYYCSPIVPLVNQIQARNLSARIAAGRPWQERAKLGTGLRQH